MLRYGPACHPARLVRQRLSPSPSLRLNLRLSLHSPRRVGALAATLLTIAAAGCATIGRDFPSERVHEIQIGKTTKGELLSRFGRPYRRGIEDGDSTWTYLAAKISLFGGQSRTRDLYIRFEGDTVRSFNYSADVP
ncbi:MAG: hypothetical protein ACE15D_02400 [Candidatus Eisenbacteria bacterium]|nr:hypothetical protein [Candidatus Eisenbacteria bacterium]